jgi:eukaryotic-like serine/threonine-protein kinase
MAEPALCPKCDHELPANAPLGLCPACLLAQVMAGGAFSLTNLSEPEVTAYWREGMPHLSALDDLETSRGDVPEISLRDACDDDENEASRPGRALPHSVPSAIGRYRLQYRIGGGGMGEVYNGGDVDLGREVALKVLREDHGKNPDLARRFVEEAQISGQLVHPGIAQTYEMGRFADGRPYFTMKLVKGDTLAVMLAARKSPLHDLPRFLAIFEQVCQTIAYAHARGVVHRDLKPPNIMVGSFGEVQVMDWGLAKVLPRGGAAQYEKNSTDPAGSVIWTARSTTRGETSQVGSVLGTPSYMAPEQASGEVELIDERADVFGLGSILCELLTGQPTYTGASTDAILRMALRGETVDALRRLEACGADAELIRLAKDCVAVEPEERPRDAGEIVRRLTAHLASVQERLQAAELARATEAARAVEARATAAAAERARAAEEARAEEAQAAAIAADGRARAERRARRMTVWLAASVLIAGALGAAGWRWVEHERALRIAARSTQVNAALQEATGLWGQAQAAAVGDRVPWAKALAAAQKADELLEPGLDYALRGRVEAVLAAITSEKEGAESAARAAESNRLLLDKLVEIRSARTEDLGGSISNLAYARAFREAGIDITVLRPSEAGARIKAWPAPTAAAMVAALDDWQIVRSVNGDQPGAQRLVETANSADPNPWRVGLRRTISVTDPALAAKRLLELAASTNLETAPAIDLQLLAVRLGRVGENKAAENVYHIGLRRFPDDVWLNYMLANFLEARSRGEEAVRYYSIARALRPETVHALAHLLDDRGESAEAIAVFRHLVRLRPDGRDWGCYGRLLKKSGDPSGSTEALEKAVAIMRRRIQLNKSDAHWDHLMLGEALSDQGHLEDGLAEFRAAIKLQPDFAAAHFRLGVKLAEMGRVDEAIKEYRAAISIQPDDAMAHDNLGCSLADQGKRDEAIAEHRTAIRLRPELANAHYNLGHALCDQKKLAEAVAEYRQAIRLRPGYAQAHNNLGAALKDQGKLAEAIASYRRAIRCDFALFQPHHNLGHILADQGKDPEAAAEFRHAVRISPADADARNDLGDALQAQGKSEEAISDYREAIRLKPEFADAHKNLAWALAFSPRRERRDYEEALVHARRSVELEPRESAMQCTLALAEYRLGRWSDSLATSRRSIALRKSVDAYDWFLLAMAHGRNGEKAEAHKWFDKALAWTRQNAPKNAGLLQFWTEAADLLGQPGPGASGPGSPGASVADKPH